MRSVARVKSSSVFAFLDVSALRLLDVGCGQGRDLLFIARLDHTVVGVDQFPAGIRDMLADAAAEKLNIEGYIGDIREFDVPGLFDMLQRRGYLFARQASE